MAIASLGELLRRNPKHKEAARLTIEIHAAAGRLGAAGESYDAYVKATGVDDPAGLAPLAGAHLRALAKEGHATVSAAALCRLASLGDAAAREELRKRSVGENSAQALAATNALARLRDPQALAHVEANVSSPVSALRARALSLLAEVDPMRARRLLVQALDDRDPAVQQVAIDAAARTGAKEAIATLTRLATMPQLGTKVAAAAALHRLGNASNDSVLQTALQSELPDARLLAASAYEGTADRGWVAAVAPLLRNPDGFVAVQAAELLLAQNGDPGAARRALTEALRDPNPAIREEATRILVRGGAEVPVLRPLLRDGSSMVRLHAASALAQFAGGK